MTSLYSFIFRLLTQVLTLENLEDSSKKLELISTFGDFLVNSDTSASSRLQANR